MTTDDLLPEDVRLDDEPEEERLTAVPLASRERRRKDMPWRDNAEFREWHEQRKIRKLMAALDAADAD